MDLFKIRIISQEYLICFTQELHFMICYNCNTGAIQINGIFIWGSNAFHVKDVSSFKFSEIILALAKSNDDLIVAFDQNSVKQILCRQ